MCFIKTNQKDSEENFHMSHTNRRAWTNCWLKTWGPAFFFFSSQKCKSYGCKTWTGRCFGTWYHWEEKCCVPMETDLRLESSLWVGNKRYLAVLTGWHFKWTEADKKSRDKKTGEWSSSCMTLELNKLSTHTEHSITTFYLSSYSWLLEQQTEEKKSFKNNVTISCLL